MTDSHRITKAVAFVTPWYGKELKGGAEQQTRQLAERLSSRGYPVEVLTTCSRTFLEEWGRNHYPGGVEKSGEILIRRFPVDKRNASLFNRANTQALSVPHEYLKPGVSPFAQSNDNAFITENINSYSLEKYLRDHNDAYHCFVFIPYLYGIIINGLPLVAEKAWLQPCLHNEAYAYHPAIENIFRKARGLLFNSDGEKELARTIFGPGIIRKSFVTGEGVETEERGPESTAPTTVQGIDLQATPYILCLGRRDSTKNTELLVSAYKKYRARKTANRIHLILAGPGDTTYGKNIEEIHDLGLVSNDAKEALLANCRFLFQPSKNESYSRVIMEAWLHGKPVAAHRDCLATSMAVTNANGGLLADDENDWCNLFLKADSITEAERAGMGANGRLYAQEFAQWETVLNRYEEILGLQEKEPPLSVEHSLYGNGTIHQLLPGFAYGDAISNQAIVIRDILRERGYRSEIFAENIDPLMAQTARSFNPNEHPQQNDAIIYHHSIGAGLTQFVVDHSGPKTLCYHNITPPELVRQFDPKLADILAQGLNDLQVLAPHFPVSFGDSLFNCNDLKKHGFSQATPFPICISPDKWNIPADPNWMAKLQDGKTNFIFVGRITPNKCQHDLLDLFAEYFRMYGNCRLLLVGGYLCEEAYFQFLKEKCKSLHLEWDVHFLGKVTDSILHACYRCADLFCSMSEHEGFGVPLIEAMWFGTPVFAFKSSAVPETMGKGGLLFDRKDDLPGLAATAKVLLDNSELRRVIIDAQYQRAKEFLPESFQQRIDTLLQEMYEESRT